MITSALKSLSTPTHPLLLDMLNGENIPYSMFRMKLAIMGDDPDERFLQDFIRIAVMKPATVQTLKDCLMHGMFKTQITWNVIKLVIDLYNVDWTSGRSISKEILYTISRSQPGRFIGLFIKYGKFFNHYPNDGMRMFEYMAKMCSKALSSKCDEYKKKTQPRVDEVLEHNRQMEMSLL